ncbi:MAG: HlyD family secretion protein [Polyangiaceae bacterium]
MFQRVALPGKSANTKQHHGNAEPAQRVLTNLSRLTMSDTVTPDRPVHDRVGPSKLLAWLRAQVPVIIILGLAALLLFAIAGRWNDWVSLGPLQTTDDAQLRADVTPLSTKSSGVVALVAVDDYQHVKAGDLLIQLRDDDFRAQVELANASVVAAQAALDNLRSQRGLQTSRIAAAQATVDATLPDVERTRLELVRAQTLEVAKVATHQRLEVATADRDRFLAQLGARRAELDAQRKQVSVLDAQEAQLRADLVAKLAALKVAQVNLDYTRIVAPTDGVVGERKVRPGQLVSAGTQVLSLVGDTTWVVANYRETQLAHVEVGDEATIRVDGVPSLAWTGRVQTISPGSGAVFSLLPPDNATGNFTKIAQRIPVKIRFEDANLDPRLRAGMSATVTIRTGR